MTSAPSETSRRGRRRREPSHVAVRRALPFRRHAKTPNRTARTPPAQTQTPAFLTQQAYQSTTAPQITPLSSYVLTCNLINNNYSVPNNLLYSFSPQGAFGSQFTIQPNFPAYINVNPGQYQFITLKLLDQNLLPISIQDPNFVIQLIITDNVTDIVLSGKGGNK